MASTQPSQQISITTIALASAGLLSAAALGYAFYFDYRRRNDADFRKSLRRQHKKVARSNEAEAKASERSQKEKIKRAVQEAAAEGFPTDPEDTETFFMQEVARGEGMCTDGSDPVDAALCFYKALKVYPQPRELINIYDKTVPKVRFSQLLDRRSESSIPEDRGYSSLRDGPLAYFTGDASWGCLHQTSLAR
jgi:mitochondrial import receptor subunit TOM20